MSGIFRTREDRNLIAEVRAMRQRIVDDAERALVEAEDRMIKAQTDLEAAQAELAWVRERYGSK